VNRKKRPLNKKPFSQWLHDNPNMHNLAPEEQQEAYQHYLEEPEAIHEPVEGG